MSIGSFNEKYFNITNLIQQEFERNINKYGDKIKCRKGCSQCCSQIFRITQLDAEIIKDYLNKTSIGEKNQLLEKASDYIFKLRQEIQNENEYHKVIKLPCPALDGNGACMIYEARPVICRKFGPPIYDYKNPGNLFACELNFSNGEEIIDSELIPNQSLIGKKWDELKTAFNKVNDLKENASTTIAEAILDS